MNCTFRDQYYYAIYAYYQRLLNIKNNDIDVGARYLSAYGISGYYCNRSVIDANKIIPGQYGIYMNYDNQGAPADTTYITNNMISNFYYPNYQNGIYLYYSYYTNTLHNSVKVAGLYNYSYSYAAFYAYYMYYGTVKNNIFASTGYAYVASFYYPQSSVVDYNDYVFSGPSTYKFAYAPPSTNITDLATFVSYNATSYPSYLGNHDLNSVNNTDPGFVSLSDLHRNATSSTLMQAPALNKVTTDIDGDSRATTVNIGADEIKPNDLDIVSVTPSTIAAMGNNNIVVTLINKGYNTLTSGTSIYLQYQTDGGSWVSQTFTLSSNLAINQTVTFTFTTAWNITVNSAHTLCTKINPQISGDADVSDQVCSTVKMGLAGTYYIDYTGAGNYTTFTLAVNDLIARGAAGAITFVVRPGTYTERIIIPMGIPGINTVNTVTFDGLHRANAILTYSGSNTNLRATLSLIGARYFTFKNMTIQNTGVNYGVGAYLGSGADYNTFDNCDIKVDRSSTNSYQQPIVASTTESSTTGSSNSANYLTVKNCNIIGGYYGITLYGSSTTSYCLSNKIINNTFTDQYYYSIYTYYQRLMTIQKNSIDIGNRNTSAYGIYSYYCYRSLYDANKIYPGQYGMYIGYENSSNVWDSSYITNNMISNFYNSTYQIGLYQTYTYYTNTLHNSIWVNGSYNSSYSYAALYVNYPYYSTFKNNILKSTGYTYIASFYYPQTCISDYNDYTYSGPSTYKFAYAPPSTSITDLTTFKSYNATSYPSYLGNHDLNSMDNVDPGFISMTDLHRNGTSSTLYQVPYINNANSDFDGDVRTSPNVNIGADELKPNDLDIVTFNPMSMAALGNNPVSMTLINRGYNTIASGTPIYLQYQADGGSWVSETYTLPAALASNQTTTYTFTTMWNITTNTIHNIVVRIYPQLTGDPDPSDQMSDIIKIGMGGTYYIDYTGAGDYTTFNLAVTDLVNRGVGRAVTFIVRPGTYTERVIIPAGIAGVNAVRTVTFDGQHRYSAVLSFSGTSTAPRATVCLTGCRYITFKNMTIQNLGVNYGVDVWLSAAADYNTIDNCDLKVDRTSTNSYQQPILASASESSTGSTGNNANYLTVKNCNIYGGYYGVTLYGTSTSTFCLYNKILNNNFVDQYYYGIYSYYQKYQTIQKNFIDIGGRTTSAYALYTYYCNRSLYDANKIYPGQYGMYINYENSGTPADTSYITNNMISNFYNTTYQTGIYMYYTYYTNTHHNSVWVNGTYNYSYSYAALYAYYPYYCSVKNNILNSTNGYTYLISWYYPTTCVCDYNDYTYSGGLITYLFAYYPPNGTIADITTFRSYNASSYPTYLGDHDLNSVVNSGPNFISIKDLHRNGTSSTLYQAPFINKVTTDFDGDSRISPTVNIGADELKPNDLDILTFSPMTMAALGSNDVSLTLINRGYNAIASGTAITLQYQTDGGSWISQTFTLASAMASNTTRIFTFTTKWVITTNVIHAITVRINPQLTGDPDPSDQMSDVVKMGMGGTYYIDYTGAGDYLTFAAALADVYSRGVGKAVRFVVRQGTYNERVNISGPILGADSNRTVTFDGQHIYNAVLTYSGNLPVISEANVSYVVFRNLTIRNTSTSYCAGINIMNGTKYCSFYDNFIDIPISTSSNFIGIMFSNSTTSYSTANTVSDYNLFQGNTVKGGWAGVTMYSNTTSQFIKYNRFIGNTFTDQYQYGFYTYYGICYNLIKGNTIKNMSSNGYGIYTYYATANTIDGNNIQPGQYGIYMYYDNYAYTSNITYIINNTISNFSNTTYQTGIYLYQYCYNTKVYHNSVWVSGSYNYSYSYAALYTYYNYYSDIRNNIFYSSGYTYIASFYYPYYSTVNYNDYVYSGPISYKFAYYPPNGNITDLATFVSYNTASGYSSYLGDHDINSLFNTLPNPNFVSNTDLHRQASASTLMQAPYINTVNHDLDNDVRGGTLANIGADELKPTDLDIQNMYPNLTAFVGQVPVAMDLVNSGYTTLTPRKLYLGYQVDSNAWVNDSFQMTSNLAAGSIIKFQFNTKWTITVDKIYRLCTRILPRITGDPDTSDTKCYQIKMGMEGVYTIDPAGSGSRNYTTFAAAVNDMLVRTVGGACTFLVAQRTFNERVVITSIPGASVYNTITFRGLNRYTSKLTWNYSGYPGNTTLVLNGAQYIRFENMTIDNSNTSYGIDIWFTNRANFNKISGCDVTVTPNTSSNSVNIYGGTNEAYPYSTGYPGDNGFSNVIENNLISGGGYYGGITWYGTSYNINYNNSFINNNIINTYQYSMYFYQVAGNKINYNKFTGPRTTSNYAIYDYYTAADTIIGNTIQPGQTGIYQYYYNNYYAPSTWYSVIASNAISNFTDPNYQIGIYMYYYSYRNKVVNNTIWVNGAYSNYNYAAIFAYYPYYCDFSNNIMINTGNEYIFSLYYPYYCTSDFNDYYYTASSYLGNPSAASAYKFNYYPYNMYILDFATYKGYLDATYLGTHDVNSYYLVDPKIISNTNLHLQPNNWGIPGQLTPLSTVPADMDMEPRCPLVSSLGADNPIFPKLTTGFMAYDTMCLFTPQTFYNMAEAAIPHYTYWYMNNSFVTSLENFTNTFNTAGVNTITLKTYSCNGYDSFTKRVVISASALKPVVEFWTPNNVVEPNQSVKLYDVSKFCPTRWKWAVSPDSVINPATGLKVISYAYVSSKDTFQNPVVTFFYPGEYNVCLTATNANGTSTKACKTAYIIVKFVDNMCGTTTFSKKPYGTIYDDGGSSAPHGLNKSCTYLIKACSDDVSVILKEFDLAVGAYLRIYDGASKRGIPMWNTSVYGLNGLTGMKGATGWKDTLLATKSGMVYIEFQSAGNTPGAGFKLEWTSIGTGSYQMPSASFQVEDTSCIVYPVFYKNTSTNCDIQLTDFRWDFDGNSIVESKAVDGIFNTTFSGISATYISQLVAENCGGIDTFEKVVVLINPTSNPIGDFHADVVHPVVSQDIVTFYNDATRLSCVNTWHWKISPNTFYYTNGTNQYSEHPKVIFADTICYTVGFVMGNTNSPFKDSLTKNCYIKPISHCIPIVLNIHQDIGISKVKMGTINNTSTMGVIAYTNYTNTQQTNLVPGQTFSVTVERTSNYNAMNRSVWIDYNSDGDFTDAGELVAHEDSAFTLSWTSSFAVPSSAVLGASVMRVGTNYANYTNSPCGPNLFGEYEDYRVFLTKDNIAPDLKIIGADTITIEKGYTYTEPGATAIDNIDGNISSKIKIVNNIDFYKVGTYQVVYTVCDKENNCSMATRTVIITEDVTPPVITLIGKDTLYTDVNLPFTDPFVTAIDKGDGDITSKVTTTGAVINTILGTYYITYRVTDSKGLSDTKKRVVFVTDGAVPTISLKGANPMYVEIMHPYIEPGDTFFDNYWPNNKINHQVSGVVDTTKIGTYTVRYSVTDASGNGPNVITRTVIVYDSTAPVITMNGVAQIQMEVNTLYADPSVSITDNSLSGFTIHKNGSFYKYFPDGIADSLGNFSIFYQAEDAAGNLSNIIARVILVVDIRAPQVKLIGDEYVTVERWSNYVDKGCVITDNYYKYADLKVDTFSNVNTLKNGLYQVTYTAQDPSGNISSVAVRMVLVMQKSGIDETSLSDRISIYPNPSNGLFTIDLMGLKDHDISVSILNSLGDEIMQVSNGSTVKGKYYVDLSTYARGIYVVKVVTNEGTALKRIVLTK